MGRTARMAGANSAHTTMPLVTGMARRPRNSNPVCGEMQRRHPLWINQLSTTRLNAECLVAYNCLGKVDAQITCQPPEPWLCERVTYCQQIFTGRVRCINR